MILTRPDRNWSWVVMVASFVIHGLNGSILYGAGIIQIALLERFNESVSLTSWAGGIFIFFMSSAGTGSGIIFTTGVVVVGLNFEKKRSLATGFASCGAGVGVFILSPVIQLAKEEYGNQGFFFIMAGIALNMFVFGSLCFPSYLEYNQEEINLSDTNLSVSLLSLSTKKVIRERVQVFANIPFILICLSLFSSHIGIYLMYVHLPNFSISTGTPAFQASFLMSVTGIMNCISRFLIGLVGNSENISNSILYFGTFALLGLSTMLFPYYGASYTGQSIYAAFLGSYSGCCYVLLNTITPNLVGVNNLATAFGIEMVFTGVGTLIGPPLAGFILDYGGTYEASFTVAGSSAVIAAVLGLASEVFRKLNHTGDKNINPETDKLFKDHNSTTNDNVTET
ncbi:monocarboxylate transporter 3-like isoform X2 [Pecten maximus]|uniref:monocarboxylate transporter 3-like isoform X2 n=1 Tax=Pecten maximus TaxID=6579 RepID=UPI001458178C|nr:monocarboxylate transporter 3-like isoform X2 [Pecten maximus]